MTPDNPNSWAVELVETLSPSLRSTLVLTSKGFTVEEIARLDNVGPRTVGDRRERLYKILGVGSAPEAAVIAAKAGIV